MEPCLNQTFERQKVFSEKGSMVRHMNLPPFQGPKTLPTLSWSASQLIFWVCELVALSCTPTISRCSDSAMYRTARSSCWRVPLHLPRGRNLTLPELGSQCKIQPEAAFVWEFLAIFFPARLSEGQYQNRIELNSACHLAWCSCSCSWYSYQICCWPGCCCRVFIACQLLSGLGRYLLTL